MIKETEEESRRKDMKRRGKLEKRYEEKKYVLERGERRLEDRRVWGKA